MTKLVLIAGVAGSGKSTIAPPLAEQLGARMVSIDPFKRAVVDPKALCEGIDPPDVRWQYYQLALDRIFELVEKGVEYIVLEEMFHVRALRERVSKACAAKGVSVRWIEVTCPDELVFERIDSRPRDGHILNSEQLRKVRKEVAEAFDPFEEGDGYLRLNNVGCAEVSVQRAVAWLQGN